MMNRRDPRLIAGIAVFLIAGAATGQRLPTGRHRPVRERTFDILHYRAEVDLDLTESRLTGRAVINLTPLRPLTQLSLDAIGLEVERVELVDEGSPLNFTMRQKSLLVDLPREWRAGESLAVAVGYSCRPRAGMYFHRNPADSGSASVFTYGEGGLHANWLPIYNDVNDKFSTEMVVTVPAPYVVVSNGRLLEVSQDQGDRITYHWLQERPHSVYLLAVYVGDLEEGKLAPAPGGVPQSYWVPKGRLEEGAIAFRNTTSMVEFFSSVFDYPYPWVKHDQVALPGFGSAMEHTGVTLHDISVLRTPEAPHDFGGPVFSEYYTDWTAEATISHELAHQWFGNSLTCRSLGSIWLNESFASYLMMLWAEESLGEDELLFALDQARRHYFEYVAAEQEIRPLEYHYFDDLNTIYNEAHTYLKGAAVVHMLRRTLGDEAFFSSMAHYLRKHEFSNVESVDLKRAVEEKTGIDLDWFFDDWITGAGHPILEVSYRYLEDLRLVDLEIRQVQAQVQGQDLFRLRLPVTLATADSTWTQVVWITEEEARLLLPSASEPIMVSIDGSGDLVAEIRFEKDAEQLAFQARHDRLPGRLRALRQMAGRFPAHPQTVPLFREILLGSGHWSLQAETARLVGKLRSPGAEELIADAFGSEDYRVRKAAVLALGTMDPSSAEVLLRERIETDPHSDVVGTALVTLAKVEPELDPSFLERQLQRESWYDEIRIATLEALQELARPELTVLAGRFTEPSWNHEVRRAALRAWKEATPTDPELHLELVRLAEEPSVLLQPFAIETLGELYVEGAVPVLEDLVRWDGDSNLTVLARQALAEIKRIRAPGSTSSP